MPACKVYPLCSSFMTRTASRRITSGVGRSGSPRPRLMLPGFARSEIFRIMLFSIPRRKAGDSNGFTRAIPHPMGLGRSAVSPKLHERPADRKQWVVTKTRLDHLSRHDARAPLLRLV